MKAKNKMFLKIFLSIILVSFIDCVCIRRTTTENVDFLCQFNTGVRLNSTALGQLSFLGSFTYTSIGTNADECCITCNRNADCDYAFQKENARTGVSNCSLYHWNIPDDITHSDLAYQIKQGDWYDGRPYSIGSGKLLYANKFLQLVW